MDWLLISTLIDLTGSLTQWSVSCVIDTHTVDKTWFKGILTGMGCCVQRYRLRESLQCIDPLGCLLRCHQPISNYTFRNTLKGTIRSWRRERGCPWVHDHLSRCQQGQSYPWCMNSWTEGLQCSPSSAQGCRVLIFSRWYIQFQIHSHLSLCTRKHRILQTSSRAYCFLEEVPEGQFRSEWVSSVNRIDVVISLAGRH